ncbi:unnamed protein product [Symbiodinium sp. CCMP2456]|nr:unnamed protein product [Symbiodinium sp. CCMP2456]
MDSKISRLCMAEPLHHAVLREQPAIAGPSSRGYKHMSSQEINAAKELTSMKVWQPDKNGLIPEVDKGFWVQAVVGCELEVQALRRRGIASAMAQVMSFSVQDELIALLFNEFQKELLDGYENVSMAQVAQAEREVHVRLGELTRAGLAPAADGMPLNNPMGEVLNTPCAACTTESKLDRAAGTSRHDAAFSNGLRPCIGWIKVVRHCGSSGGLREIGIRYSSAVAQGSW